jgi:hypothetical protein
MINLPKRINDFSAPDADISQTVAKIRTALRLMGNNQMANMSDATLAEAYIPKVVKIDKIYQPGGDKSVPVSRPISLGELKEIITTRARFADYRSDVYISPEMKAKILASVEQNETLKQPYYTGQPFTIVSGGKGKDVAIPDQIAYDALENSKTVIPLVTTDFNPKSKPDTAMSKRYRDRHPVAFNAYPRYEHNGFMSIVEPLDSFSSFAEVATSATSGFWGGLLGSVVGAGTTIGTAVLQNKLEGKALNAQAAANQALAAQLAAQNKPAPSNNMPLILGALGVGLLIIVMSKRK